MRHILLINRLIKELEKKVNDWIEKDNTGTHKETAESVLELENK